MANFYQLIARAVAELNPDSPQRRQVIYDRARTALLKQLETMDPPPDEIERTKERLGVGRSDARQCHIAAPIDANVGKPGVAREPTRWAL